MVGDDTGWNSEVFGRFAVNEAKRTLGEQAYEAIREAILSLRLEPGQAVYEAELGSMLNMSRTPIREAVRTLLVEELIEVLPQRGMKVALISVDKVEETRFVRESLEVSGIRQVIDKWDHTSASFVRLERDLTDCIENQKKASNAGDMEAFLQADELFHRLLLFPTGNKTLLSIVSQMRGHLNRVRALSLRDLQNVDVLISEHEVLMKTVSDRDEDKAVKLLTNHLRRLSKDILQVKQRFREYFLP